MYPIKVILPFDVLKLLLVAGVNALPVHFDLVEVVAILVKSIFLPLMVTLLPKLGIVALAGCRRNTDVSE